MEFNPYRNRYAALSRELSDTERAASDQAEQLKWYKAFDLDTAVSVLRSATQETLLLKAEIDTNAFAIDNMKRKVKSLEEQIRPGLDPRYWFSAERSVRKRNHEGCARTLAGLESHRAKLHARLGPIGNQLRAHQTNVDRYRSFDSQQVGNAVQTLHARIEHIRTEMVQLQPELERVDRKLAVHKAERAALLERQGDLFARIDTANDLESRLDNAQNSYERKLVHEESELVLRMASPARARSAAQRELESIERGIAKLEQRMKEIAHRATRVIRSVVMDGNNLCYEHGRFIGLSALRAVAAQLVTDYKVIIVFDASIRHHLVASTADIKTAFGDGVTVHIVQNKADETILDYAVDGDAFIVSNDRFGDFPDKLPVRERRVIQHEMLDGKIFIHDLDIGTSYATTA